MGVTRQVLVQMSEREYEWLQTYAELHELSIAATLRVAIRTHNMLHLTPGALDAVVALQPRFPLLAEDDTP
jgi:hypothetical protein